LGDKGIIGKLGFRLSAARNADKSDDKQLTRPVTHDSSTRQQRFQHASDEANNPLLKAKRERD
jgi:hypothetical protein